MHRYYTKPPPCSQANGAANATINAANSRSQIWRTYTEDEHQEGIDASS
jgi:hypothetical protein